MPCFQFLKAIILKTFNEIGLTFLSVESKANILYVNMNFSGNLLFGFSRYCGKVVQESFLNKVANLQPASFLKETPTQVLSCEVCKTFQSLYFEPYLQTTSTGGAL